MPVGGDALKATNKIGKFALKNADDIGIYAEILSFANKNFQDAVNNGLTSIGKGQQTTFLSDRAIKLLNNGMKGKT